jgi:hypothetical protein
MPAPVALRAGVGDGESGAVVKMTTAGLAGVRAVPAAGSGPAAGAGDVSDESLMAGEGLEAGLGLGLSLASTKKMPARLPPARLDEDPCAKAMKEGLDAGPDVCKSIIDEGPAAAEAHTYRNQLRA